MDEITVRLSAIFLGLTIANVLMAAFTGQWPKAFDHSWFEATALFCVWLNFKLDKMGLL